MPLECNIKTTADLYKGYNENNPEDSVRGKILAGLSLYNQKRKKQGDSVVTEDDLMSKAALKECYIERLQLIGHWRDLFDEVLEGEEDKTLLDLMEEDIEETREANSEIEKILWGDNWLGTIKERINRLTIRDIVQIYNNLDGTNLENLKKMYDLWFLLAHDEVLREKADLLMVELVDLIGAQYEKDKADCDIWKANTLLLGNDNKASKKLNKILERLGYRDDFVAEKVNALV